MDEMGGFSAASAKATDSAASFLAIASISLADSSVRIPSSIMRAFQRFTGSWFFLYSAISSGVRYFLWLASATE